MKKILLSALVLMASALVAQAQGFRVYRSDGAVYQFRWVADSIAFFEGEGDPDYQEPVPESVQNALNELRAYVANNAASIAAVNNLTSENRMNIQSLQSLVAALQASGQQNQNNIASLQSSISEIQTSVTAMNAKVDMVQGLISALQQDVQRNKQSIETLQAISADLQASIAASVNRIGALESAISALQTNSDSYAELIGMLQSRVIDIQDQNQVQGNDIAVLQGRANTAEETIADLRQRNSDLERVNAALSDRVDANTSTIENLTQKILLLSDRLDTLENQMNQ